VLGVAGLLRAWVLGTLAGLANDDELHAWLRETLLVFLRTGGSVKTAAEQLMLSAGQPRARLYGSPPPVMITIAGSGRTDWKPGQASARIRYAAGRASRSVSSWIPMAISFRAEECCRL
jgi:hypothetical protein